MDKTLKILMVGSDLSVKGGMTSVVKAFLNHDFKNQIDIMYIPTHIEGVANIKKIVFFMHSILNIISTLLREDISIIHMHMSEKGSFYRKFIIYLLGKVFRKKIIVHMHGAEFKEYFNQGNFIRKKLIKNMLIGSHKVIVLGDSWNKFVKNIDEKINTIILRNAVDIQNKIAEYKDNNVNILFLAVLIERKGIFDLVHIAELLTKDNDLKRYNIKFLIAGSGKDEDVMKEKIRNHNLQDYFKFEGWVDKEQKEELFIKSQIYILPSYNEGLPVSILEAMSYGLPIITTNVGSIEDAVEHGVNGFVTDCGDSVKMYKYIKKCIINHEMWKDFSIKSKDIIENFYSADKYFISIENLYKSLC